MTIDYSDDYQYWDNSEAVTVTVRRAGSNEEVSVSIAVRESGDTSSEFFNGIRLRGDELLWHVPVALMDSNEIEPGDEIKDAGNVKYNVQSVVKAGVGNSAVEFQCLCKKQR